MDRKKLIDREKNPFYKHTDAEFYLAEHEGEVVGRIGAIVNYNHNKEHDENIGSSDFLNASMIISSECTLRQSQRVLTCSWRNGDAGPANPSVNDEYGLLVEGFDVSPPL